MPAIVVACAEGPVLVLGDLEPPRYRFDPPQVVSELSADAKTDNPTLTADMLEIFFTSERDGAPADVYFASRSERSEPFRDVRRVAAVSTEALETSPAISLDGLTLWVGSERPGGKGGLDIWSVTRPSRNAAWSTPRNLAALNSIAQDIPRPPGLDDRVMPMASDRDSVPFYQVQFAARSDSQGPFAPPSVVSELSFSDESTVDAQLTADGLTVFYVTGPAFGPADIYAAFRTSVSEPFEQHVPLDDLNTPGDERDPWLSPDGHEMYFSSDRSGHYEIYVANAHLEPAGR